VAGGILGKLFGRSPATSPEVADALAELTRLSEARASLSAPICMLREILPALFAGPEESMPAPLPGGLTVTVAAGKLTDGIPLLRGEPVTVDIPSFRRRWQVVCAAVDRHQNPDGGKALAHALEHGSLEPAELLASVLAGKPDEIHARADALGLDAGLTTAVLGLVLFPVLGPVNVGLAPLRRGIAWDHGYCPTCGSWPLLGEFRGLEQTRFLRCGLCTAEWEFPRSACVYCGERDHRQLGYLGVEGEESRHRVSTCETCRGYVKMVTSLAALSAPALLVANIATLHLDLAAADRGYASPPVLAEPDA
jgi:FdhE protein